MIVQLMEDVIINPNFLPVGQLSEIAPLAIPILIFMIPIIAILTSHQQRMAKIMHESGQLGNNAEINALRGEVQQLRELVHQQAIQVDNLIQLQTRQTVNPSQDLQSRLEN